MIVSTASWLRSAVRWSSSCTIGPAVESMTGASSRSSISAMPLTETAVVTAAIEPVAVATARRRLRRTATTRSSSSRIAFASSVSEMHVSAIASEGQSIRVGAL